MFLLFVFICLGFIYLFIIYFHFTIYYMFNVLYHLLLFYDGIHVKHDFKLDCVLSAQEVSHPKWTPDSAFLDCASKYVGTAAVLLLGVYPAAEILLCFLLSTETLPELQGTPQLPLFFTLSLVKQLQASQGPLGLTVLPGPLQWDAQQRLRQMLPPDFVVVVLVQAQQMAAELGLHAHSLILLKGCPEFWEANNPLLFGYQKVSWKWQSRAESLKRRK